MRDDRYIHGPVRTTKKLHILLWSQRAYTIHNTCTTFNSYSASYWLVRNKDEKWYFSKMGYQKKCLWLGTGRNIIDYHVPPPSHRNLSFSIHRFHVQDSRIGLGHGSGGNFRCWSEPHNFPPPILIGFRSHYNCLQRYEKDPTKDTI